MWEWLLSPIDPARAHDVGLALSWHGRAMVVAWGGLAPLAVLIARFFKILPGQDWPRVLDSKLWWRTHWVGQTCVLILTIFGLYLILPRDPGTVSLHGWLGYSVVAGLVLQVGLGVFRGSKGGPTDLRSDGSPRGHHFDMTAWRLTFEVMHKSIGYGVLFVAAVAILAGLWHANAPNWMWLSLISWWCFLIAVFAVCQKRGMAVDTYQAIWGDDPALPGNKRSMPGWGVRRMTVGSTSTETRPTNADGELSNN
ncbi:MAG: cytochrome b561 domain-containing protein [Pseudomonadota bacterium]